MGLIDANALKERYTRNGEYETCIYDGAFVVKQIEEQPTIDAVEVVRCKDCTFFSACTDFTGKCDLRGDYIFTKDFCSYAVRRTDEFD